MGGVVSAKPHSHSQMTRAPSTNEFVLHWERSSQCFNTINPTMLTVPPPTTTQSLVLVIFSMTRASQVCLSTVTSLRLVRQLPSIRPSPKASRLSKLFSSSLFHADPRRAMASLSSCMFAYRVRSWAIRGSDPSTQKPKMNSIKINGNPCIGGTGKGEAPNYTSSTAAALSSVASVAKPAYVEDQYRQNIPTKKQLVDPFRHGLIIEGGIGYRQTVVIRSYEVGPDKTATLESILNLLQETALNHVWMSGLLGDGFGATHGMLRNNLIWVVTRMQVQVDSYPIWGEIVEIDTWVGASGKNGMQRDWLIRSHLSGQVFARGTSTWVMMNQHTRRLSKMPEEVRGEISPWFTDKQAIPEDASDKIEKLDDTAKYVICNLKPKRSDLDMNHHVNNVKYVKWMLEAIPDSFLKNHQLSSIILEYRRECGRSDMVQSLCQPDEEIVKEESNETELVRRFSLAPEIVIGNGKMSSLQKWPLRYTHLLQIKGESKNEEIVRGRTIWKKKPSLKPFSNI